MFELYGLGDEERRIVEADEEPRKNILSTPKQNQPQVVLIPFLLKMLLAAGILN